MEGCDQVGLQGLGQVGLGTELASHCVHAHRLAGYDRVGRVELPMRMYLFLVDVRNLSNEKVKQVCVHPLLGAQQHLKRNTQPGAALGACARATRPRKLVRTRRAQKTAQQQRQ